MATVVLSDDLYIMLIVYLLGRLVRNVYLYRCTIINKTMYSLTTLELLYCHTGDHSGTNFESPNFDFKLIGP